MPKINYLLFSHKNHEDLVLFFFFLTISVSFWFIFVVLFIDVKKLTQLQTIYTIREPKVNSDWKHTGNEQIKSQKKKKIKMYIRQSHAIISISIFFLFFCFYVFIYFICILFFNVESCEMTNRLMRLSRQSFFWIIAAEKIRPKSKREKFKWKIRKNKKILYIKFKNLEK